ncbi:hypothetical protein Tco_0656831 [Tanacetum coccineum]|uniref:Uncharacterized protein n=1 Tax=Tanacetum coccineum TaxID=301880 RepID=A0ABQ4XAA4_9ASTR
MDVTTVVTPSNDKTVENKGVSNTVETNVVRINNSSAPIIEDWNSDDESEIDYTVRPSTEKIKSIKTVKETDAPKQNKHHPRGNRRNWNNLISQRLGSDFKIINKACYVCGSFEHLHYVCDKKVVRPVWNNSRRGNPHQKGYKEIVVIDSGCSRHMTGNVTPSNWVAAEYGLGVVLFDEKNLEVLRNFIGMILRGRFNTLSHVSTPL